MTMELSDKARETRNEYMRKWKEKNLDYKQKQSAYLQEWRKNNPDKIRKYNVDYWERKAKNS